MAGKGGAIQSSSFQSQGWDPFWPPGPDDEAGNMRGQIRDETVTSNTLLSVLPLAFMVSIPAQLKYTQSE